ncbi:MAG TPA: polyphenol oxidase family protein [Magnetospirillaceae bacterium]|nr:polyphenol oxidase family protein [Magnetospirillaceae bacterium]
MTYAEVPLESVRADGVLRFPIGRDPQAPWAILSLRSGGSMRYIHGEPNPVRERFFRNCGIDPGRVLAVELVHSREVLYPQGAEDTRGMRADGIIVGPGPWVPTVTVADCMPIWIRHERSGAYGVLHSGWQGTGILKAAVMGLAARFKADPREIDAVLGPAIGPCCYCVPEERARAFRSEFGGRAALLQGGAWRLDLAAANLGIARRLGLRSLMRLSGCTCCDADLGSFRREGPEGFTRMVAAAACLGPEPRDGACGTVMRTAASSPARRRVTDARPAVP